MSFCSGRRLSILAALLAALLLLPACASRQPDPAPGTKLAASPSTAGEKALVTVTGGDRTFCRDFAALVEGEIVRERSLRRAQSAAEADVLVTVDVKDIALVAGDGSPAGGGRSALGVGLGAGVGVGHPGHVGTGLGGLLGMGIPVGDEGPESTWALVAEVSIAGRDGKAAPQSYEAAATRSGFTRDAAIRVLGERLGKDVAEALKNR